MVSHSYARPLLARELESAERMMKHGVIALSLIAATGGLAEARGKFGVGLRTSAQSIASENDVDNPTEMAGGGIHVRYRASKRWGFELSSEHVSHERAGGSYTRESQPVTLTASWHFGRQIFWDWYLLGGIGGTESEVTYRKIDNSMSTEVFTETHVHLGIGLERSFGCFAIGAELRVVGLERDPEAGDAYRYEAEQDGPVPASSSGTQFNLAATYYF